MVFKATDAVTNEIIALKKIQMELDTEGIPATAMREICILKELNHPNIVTLKDIITSEQKLYLVLEFCDKDMKGMLNSLPAGQLLDPLEVKSYVYQLIAGTEFCHRKRIMHRDLKP